MAPVLREITPNLFSGMQPHTSSWYAATANPWASRAPLSGDTSCDVCVVGGGFTGCSAALHLAERGYRVILIEGERIGFGASGRSGGQLIAGYNRGQTLISRLVGHDDARLMWEINEEAIRLVRKRIARHQIDCDFVSGQLTLGEKPRHERDIAETYEEWSALGRPHLEVWDRAKTQEQVGSPCYTSALYDPNGGHLHPLNMTLGLARAAEEAGAILHEGTPMLAWEKGDPASVVTPSGRIRAKFVLLAGNAYMWRTERRIGQKIMPVGTYILATEPLGENRARSLIRGNEAAADLNFVLNYFRLSRDHRMLFGGRVSYSRVEPGSVKLAMRRTMLHYFPQLSDTQVEFAWGGYVAITVNRLPHFGRLAPNVLFAQGFSGHGVALAPMAGKLMAEAVAGQAERFDVMSRVPHATFPGGTLMRTPALVLAMAWHRLRDKL